MLRPSSSSRALRRPASRASSRGRCACRRAYRRTPWPLGGSRLRGACRDPDLVEPGLDLVESPAELVDRVLGVGQRSDDPFCVLAGAGAIILLGLCVGAPNDGACDAGSQKRDERDPKYHLDSADQSTDGRGGYVVAVATVVTVCMAHQNARPRDGKFWGSATRITIAPAKPNVTKASANPTVTDRALAILATWRSMNDPCSAFGEESTWGSPPVSSGSRRSAMSFPSGHGRLRHHLSGASRPERRRLSDETR